MPEHTTADRGSGQHEHKPPTAEAPASDAASDQVPDVPGPDVDQQNPADGKEARPVAPGQASAATGPENAQADPPPAAEPQRGEAAAAPPPPAAEPGGDRSPAAGEREPTRDTDDGGRPREQPPAAAAERDDSGTAPGTSPDAAVLPPKPDATARLRALAAPHGLTVTAEQLSPAVTLTSITNGDRIETTAPGVAQPISTTATAPSGQAPVGGTGTQPRREEAAGDGPVGPVTGPSAVGKAAVSRSYRLTRQLPDGTVKEHSREFTSLRAAAQAVAYTLADNGADDRKDAAAFASRLQDAAPGTTMTHPSGYSFTIRPVAAAAPLANMDLAAELDRMPGTVFARWLSMAGMPPGVGDLDYQRPGAGSWAAISAAGIEITVTGPDVTRHGLLGWSEVAGWIDKGVTPARLGIVGTASRLGAFVEHHRDQLAAAGDCDPGAVAAELAQIRGTAIAAILDAARRGRGAAAPVPLALPGDAAWPMAVAVTRPGRGQGRTENKALERLLALRALVREPQPLTPHDARDAIRRVVNLAEVARATDSPAAMRRWIEKAGRAPSGSYDDSGRTWHGTGPDGLTVDRQGDDRAPHVIAWDHVLAWVAPGLTDGLREELIVADDASRAVMHGKFGAVINPATQAAPSDEEQHQTSQRLRAAHDAVWAAIQVAPPPSPADFDRARYAARDTGPVQETLFGLRDVPDSADDADAATDLPPAGQPGRPAPGGAEPVEPAPGTGGQATAAKLEPSARELPPGAADGTTARGGQAPERPEPQRQPPAEESAASLLDPNGNFIPLSDLDQNPLAQQEPAAARSHRMDEYDIEEAVERWRDHPLLGPASRTMAALQAWADDGKDGWMTWPLPMRAAQRLMELIERDGSRRYQDDPVRADVTAQDLKMAYAPIKGLRTKMRAGFEIEEAVVPAARTRRAPVQRHQDEAAPVSSGANRMPVGLDRDAAPAQRPPVGDVPQVSTQALGKAPPRASSRSRPEQAAPPVPSEPAHAAVDRSAGHDPQPLRPAPDTHRQDELPAANATAVSADAEAGTRRGREPAALPQPAATQDPLSDDDIDNNEANQALIARDDGTGLRVLDSAAYDRFLAKGEENGYARQHRGAGSAPAASETGRIELPAARNSGHAIRPGTLGQDRTRLGRDAETGPGSPRPVGLQRGLTSEPAPQPQATETVGDADAGAASQADGTNASVAEDPARQANPVAAGEHSTDGPSPVVLPPEHGGAAETAFPPAPIPDVSPSVEENIMPSERLTSITVQAEPLVPDEVGAVAGPVSRPAGRSGSDRRSAQAGDGADLLGELDRVLEAIIERRRGSTNQNGGPRDDFDDIRGAFALLRNALDLGGTAGLAMGYAPYPSFTAPPVLAPAGTEPARAAGPPAGGFDDIRAAFADLRQVLDLPAGGRHARGPGGPPDDRDGRLLDRAAEEAQACARWYQDTPEWQRIATIGRAARELITAIRDAAKDWWAEIRQDIRVRGFARTVASRVCLGVSASAHLLASRLERHGRAGTRTWRAASGLHRATSTYADRIMKYTPPGADLMADARRILGDLDGARRPAHASGVSGTEREENPVRLARTSFTGRPTVVNSAPAAEPAQRPAPQTATRRHGAHRA
jgi:hypothetical protein